MAIMNRYLSPLGEAGQFANRRPVMRGCVLLLLLIMLGLGGSGCGSIYQQTGATLPPGPCAQLKFRVDEAQRAEKLAEQTITKLHDRLDHGLSGEAIEIDVDRVETAAFEFDRRVASARDAAAHCEEQTQLASEIEHLHERSTNLLKNIQAMRRGGNPPDARQLDDLFHNSARP